MATWPSWLKRKRLPCRRIRRSLCMPSRGACQWSERLRNLRRTWLWKIPANPQACRLHALSPCNGQAKNLSHNVQTRAWLVHLAVLVSWSKYRVWPIWNLNKSNKYSKSPEHNVDYQLRRMRVIVARVVRRNCNRAKAVLCSSYLSKTHQRRPGRPTKCRITSEMLNRRRQCLIEAPQGA